MTIKHWQLLFPNSEGMKILSNEALDAIQGASQECVATLGAGISGLGNLLACAASNEDSGLNPDAVESVGWMLESLGSLVCVLGDSGNGAAWIAAENAKRVKQPGSVLAHRPGKATLGETNVRKQS